MIKKIPCGGFFYDDETIEFDGKVISAKGGGGESKNIYAMGFDDTDSRYYCTNLTTGEEDDYNTGGTTVSEQLYAEFMENPYSLIGRVFRDGYSVVGVEGNAMVALYKDGFAAKLANISWRADSKTWN